MFDLPEKSCFRHHPNFRYDSSNTFNNLGRRHRYLFFFPVNHSLKMVCQSSNSKKGPLPYHYYWIDSPNWSSSSRRKYTNCPFHNYIAFQKIEVNQVQTFLNVRWSAYMNEKNVSLQLPQSSETIHLIQKSKVHFSDFSDDDYVESSQRPNTFKTNRPTHC